MMRTVIVMRSRNRSDGTRKRRVMTTTNRAIILFAVAVSAAAATAVVNSFTAINPSRQRKSWESVSVTTQRIYAIATNAPVVVVPKNSKPVTINATTITSSSNRGSIISTTSTNNNKNQKFFHDASRIRNTAVVSKVRSCMQKRSRSLKITAAATFVLLSTISTTNILQNLSFLATKPLRTTALSLLPRKRGILLLMLLLLLFHQSIDVYRTKRRQRHDPTCEWTRYAKHPMLRGRAVCNLLLCKVLPLYVLSKCMEYITTRINRRPRQNTTTNQHYEWHNRLLNYSGSIFSNGLVRLGPLYIKIGQILSCQTSSSSNNAALELPKQWIEAFQKTLQDSVPARTGTDAQQLAFTAWNTTSSVQHEFHSVFPTVNWEPIAAASLGQVHIGQLAALNNTTTTTTVAMKIQRPFLKQIYESDFQVMVRIATWIDTMTVLLLNKKKKKHNSNAVSWKQIFQDTETILYREINYIDEAKNGIRFCSDFGLFHQQQPNTTTTTTIRRPHSYYNHTLPSASTWLRAPYVYTDYCTEQLLVMEYIPTIKMTAELRKHGITEADQTYLATCLARAYLLQFCYHRFFSTDPHAGNLGVELLDMTSTVPAKRVRLVFFDFGQVTELSIDQSNGILNILQAIIDMDVDRSISAFQQMGVLKEGADLDVVRDKVADNYRTGMLKATKKQHESTSQQKQNSSTTVPSSADVMQYFTVPTEYAFVARALTQIDGVGKTLDPDFDFITYCAPFIYEIKGTRTFMKEESVKWFQKMFVF